MENCVIKTSAISSSKHIERERKILKMLGQDAEGSLYITKHEKTLDLHMKLGSVSKIVGALLLSPKGIPVLQYLQSQKYRVDVLEFAMKTLDHVTKALEFIHKRGIVHNDGLTVIADRTII